MFSKCATGVKINNIILLDTLPSICSDNSSYYLNKLRVKVESTWKNLYEQLTTLQKLVFLSATFLLFAPIPLCTASTLTKLQTLWVCLHLRQFLAVPLTLGILHSSLNWECTLSSWESIKIKCEVFMPWRWQCEFAGLGHVLHASDKKIIDTMQKWSSPCSEGGERLPTPLPWSHLHHGLKNSPTEGEAYYLHTQCTFYFLFCLASEYIFFHNLLLCAFL